MNAKECMIEADKLLQKWSCYSIENRRYIEKIFKMCIRDRIGTFLCRLAPNYMRFHLVEWSFVRRHKKEWECRYVLALSLIHISPDPVHNRTRYTIRSAGSDFEAVHEQPACGK